MEPRRVHMIIIHGTWDGWGEWSWWESVPAPLAGGNPRHETGGAADPGGKVHLPRWRGAIHGTGRAGRLILVGKYTCPVGGRGQPTARDGRGG
jgi:hypothetical protein